MLVAVDFGADLFFEVALKAEQLVLVHEHLHQKVESVFGVDRFENFLFVSDVEVPVRGYDVTEHLWVVDVAHGARYLLRELRVEAHVLLKSAQDGAHQRAQLRRNRRTLGVQNYDGREHEGVVRGHFLDLGAASALDDDLERAVRQADVLEHLADRADLIKPLRLERVAVRTLFRDDEERAVTVGRLFYGTDGLRPAYEKRRNYAGEYDEIPNRDHGIDKRLTLLRHRSLRPFPQAAARFPRRRPSSPSASRHANACSVSRTAGRA